MGIQRSASIVNMDKNLNAIQNLRVNMRGRSKSVNIDGTDTGTTTENKIIHRLRIEIPQSQNHITLYVSNKTTHSSLKQRIINKINNTNPKDKNIDIQDRVLICKKCGKLEGDIPFKT